MPDLAVRPGREKELSALLLYLLAQEEEQARRGSFSAARFESQLRSGMTQPLADTYLRAAEQLQREVNQPFNRPQWEAEAQRWAAAYAKQLATEIAATTADGVEQAIRKARESGMAADAYWVGLFSPARAESIAVTETTRSITAGERRLIDRYSQRVGGDIAPLAIAVWQVEDMSACPVCLKLNGTPEEAWGETFRDGPPAHPRCLLPGSIVEGRISGALKARYSGKAIEIATASGETLRVTTNHPVLTSAGFLAANALREGQQLLRNLLVTEVPGLMANNQKQPPARIEDVFGALSKDPQLRSCANPAAVDFHGDELSLQGHVDVVWPYRVLLTRCKTAVNERLRKQCLVGANVQLPRKPCLCPEHLLAFGMSMFPSGCPRPAALPFDERGIGLDLLPLDPLLFGGGAEACAVFEQVLSQSERAAVLFESTTGNTGLYRKLIERAPGVVSTDKIVNVREFDFDGHVYDLSTVDGMYFSNGIITHNCRCYLRWNFTYTR